MGLIQLILVLVVVGVILYCINKWVPMDETVKTILNMAVVVFLVIWLVMAFFPGLGSEMSSIRIGK